MCYKFGLSKTTVDSPGSTIIPYGRHYLLVYDRQYIVVCFTKITAKVTAPTGTGRGHEDGEVTQG